MYGTRINECGRNHDIENIRKEANEHVYGKNRKNDNVCEIDIKFIMTHSLSALMAMNEEKYSK